MKGYYDLEGWQILAGPQELEIERACRISEAVRHHCDFSLITIAKRVTGDVTLECLVVDVETDGVPKHNSVGIQYRERLALVVSKDPSQLVIVWALRKSFPTVIHLNQHQLGNPASLCLYFAPSTEVYRTWTPQNFLRRIQWWLEKTARKELHSADQPVEQLFFQSKYELVLPWNIDQLKNAGEQLVILLGITRPDEGATYFITTRRESASRAACTHIELTLNPIIQGHVESDPGKLGQLHDILSGRGTDVLGPLKAELRNLLSQDGVIEDPNDIFCAILLHIPITRSEGKPPERMAHRAFIIDAGPLVLSEQLGISFKHEGRYFDSSGVLGAEDVSGWRDVSLFPMDVRIQNTKEEARRQSGISEVGPNGVLIGAGSLGSAMLNIWGRSGWGNWTVIDKDHIKPHNLSRHTAYSSQIGQMKATITAELNLFATGGANPVIAIAADACNLGLDTVISALQEASLIVDASTTLEYPRLASSRDGVARHATTFITPNGQSAVLMIEDADRKIRLRTLEAQYYRALIREDWGSHHLVGNQSTFWSGASCRDISFVFSYASMMVHAGMLANHIQRLSSDPLPNIRIWEGNPETGEITAHKVEIFEEKHHLLNGYTIYVDNGVHKHLQRMRQEQLPNETGGVLLGYYDLNLQTVVLVDALSAPPDSKATALSFERGVKNLAEKLEEISKRTAAIVGYIGEWHSHPTGASTKPSSEDIYQMIYLTLGMADDGLPAIQIIVGDGDMSIIQGRAA